MLTITINGLDEVKKALGHLASQVPFAAARAITKTGLQMKKDLKAEMGRVFDRPTPFTMQSLFLDPATKQSLEAKVGLIDQSFKGKTAVDYLLPQIIGGSRDVKRFELHLRGAGILAPGLFVVPGSGARLDRYGNVSRGQYVQVLSALGAHPDPFSNRSNSRRSRRKIPTANYFVATTTVSIVGGEMVKRKSNLKPGIYQKSGLAIKPVFIFVRQPKYSPRFRFFDVAERTVRANLMRNMQESLAVAIRTAR